MQNGGFLDNRSNKPIGLGIVIAAHAAVLAAIALAPPDVFTRITYVPIQTIAIPDDPPPPEPMARQTKAAEPGPTRIDTLVKSAPPADQMPTVDLRPIETIETTVTDPLPLPIKPVFVAATADPSAAGRFQPDYPLSLVRAGVEGSATVRILIAANGRVKAVELVNASDAAFFEATRKQALRYWRFKPATTDGVATESWRTMTVRFKLQS